MIGFPFEHLSLAEVAESDELVAAGKHDLDRSKFYLRTQWLLARRHPPLYDRIPEAGDAA